MDSYTTQGISNHYVPSQTVPFYHDRCPNCGYCPYCGRKDQPFKDHWEPYKITWTTTTNSQPQAVNPSSVFEKGSAASFVTSDHSGPVDRY